MLHQFQGNHLAPATFQITFVHDALWNTAQGEKGLFGEPCRASPVGHCMGGGEGPDSFSRASQQLLESFSHTGREPASCPPGPACSFPKASSIGQPHSTRSCLCLPPSLPQSRRAGVSPSQYNLRAAPPLSSSAQRAPIQCHFPAVPCPAHSVWMLFPPFWGPVPARAPGSSTC